MRRGFAVLLWLAALASANHSAAAERTDRELASSADFRVRVQAALRLGRTGRLAARSALDASLRELIKIRVSQINACAFCIAMHVAEARRLGVGEQRMHLLAAWREAPIYSAAERAAEGSARVGRRKCVAARLMGWAGHRNGGSLLSVRFGNVLGSRGSVLPLFRSQIERGGPVTVTHPDVTRFFMTIEEACQLVIQAGAMGYNGEVMVLDMGEPVRIADLARRLIAEADRPVQIEYTGLRPGEKMHEVLFSPDEQAVLSEHPLISRVEVPPVHPAELGLQFDGVEASGTASVRAIGSIRLEETA